MALKILLADDSMTAQNMGKKILADAGHEVLAVSNGAAAIKKIASDRPDIIILDVYMPGYTGLEVCERVKAATETSRIPVLLTVGKMEPFKPEEANRVRADGVMIKPFEATDLIAAIDGISKKMKSATASGGPSPVPSIAKQLHVEPAPQIEATPQANADHEETLRLTPEQVRALQEQSFKDWDRREIQQTTEPKKDAASSVEPAVPLEAPDPHGPLEVSAVSILEPADSSMISEEPAAIAYAPGLDATEAPMTRAMAGHDFFTVTPPSDAPAEEESYAQNSPAAFFAAEESTTVAGSEPVFKLQQFEEPEPEVAQFSASSFESVTPELETSAPVVTSPSFVARLDELETVATSQADGVAEPVAELEINSPIHLQPEVNVVQDAALVTDADDLNQFATRFGAEGAEPVEVGIAADLPADQLAAVNPAEADTASFTVQQLEVASTVKPEEIQQEEPVVEAVDSFVQPLVSHEAPAPVLENAIVITPEPEPANEVAPGFLGEVGLIEAESPLNGTARMVAYVPTVEDTQPIPAFVSTEPILPVATEELVVPEAVSETSSAPVVEAAAAAAAGADVAAAHYFIASQPVQSLEGPDANGFVPSVSESIASANIAEETANDFVPEQPIDNVALAEELARNLAEKEAAVIASTAVVESEPAASEETVEPGSETMRLTDAVARAFDRLRPTLIAEILKEIKK